MASGAKEHDEDWESAEKIIQQKLLLVSDDVVDDWEQHLDEEPKPEPVPSAAPSKDKPVKKEPKPAKAKGTENSEASGEQVRDLTKEEQLRAIIESDKQLLQELIGSTDALRIDTFAPKDANDFKTLASAIVDRCGQFKSTEYFNALAEQIVRGLCNLADLKDARRFNQLLTSDIDARNKAEKAKSKASKQKGGKLQLGNAVKIGGKGGKGVDMRVVTDEYEDFYGPSGSAAAQRSDVEDEEEAKPAAPAPAASTSSTAVAAREDPKKETVPANFDEESFL
jgi:hypothetical protein